LDKIIAVVSHFHPVLVHLPIGILLLAAGFEWVGQYSRYAALRQSVLFTLWAGTLAALFSCLTGWLLATSGDFEGVALERHRWLGIGIGTVSLLACILPAWRRILLGITAILLLFTGYFGISLTHGENFLMQPSDENTNTIEQSTDRETASLLPDTPITPAATITLEKLRKSGIAVWPVAQNSNYIAVNFVNAPQPPDSVITWLVSLAPQVITLNLSGVQLSDIAWKGIGSMTQVAQLYLRKSNITDTLLTLLAPLSRLQSVNAGQTRVSATGIQLLAASLPALRQVYLFDTEISRADYIRLQKNFPNIRIDTGRYVVPMLASDTSRLKFIK